MIRDRCCGVWRCRDWRPTELDASAIHTTTPADLRLAQKLRQLGDIRRDPPRAKQVASLSRPILKCLVRGGAQSNWFKATVFRTEMTDLCVNCQIKCQVAVFVDCRRQNCEPG
jgi:hypothetical protein